MRLLFESQFCHCLGIALLSLGLAVDSLGRPPSARNSKLPSTSSLPSSEAHQRYVIHPPSFELLARGYTQPRSPGESNFFVDLWSRGDLESFARSSGLTNNQALFVDSHGGASAVAGHQGYCFYPNAVLLSPGDATPRFCAADFANLLGRSNSEKIHNIVLAGCNQEGALHSSALRRYFINATNIIYMEAGRRSYKPMLYQALSRNSDCIKPLYGRLRPVTDGRLECDVSARDEGGAQLLGCYRADLYLPGSRSPYRRQKAGRELLDSSAALRLVTSSGGR